MNPEFMVKYKYEYEEVVLRERTLDLPHEVSEDELVKLINDDILANKEDSTVHYELLDYYKDDFRNNR